MVIIRRMNKCASATAFIDKIYSLTFIDKIYTFPYIYMQKPEVVGWQAAGEQPAIVEESNNFKVEEPLKMCN